MSSSSSSPQQPIDFTALNTETRRIISAHSRHFLALTLLFLLPLSFLITISSTLYSLLLLPSHSHLQNLTLILQNPNLHNPNSFLLCITFLLSITFLFLSASASISHSTYNGFFGRPVKLVNSLRSVLHSFLPLLFTTLYSVFIQFTISAIAIVILVSVATRFESIGIGNGRIGFLFRVVIGVGLLLYLNVYWALANVIVVLEGSRGTAAFRRSVKLVKGMRQLVFMCVLYFACLIGFFVWFGLKSYEDLQELSSSWVTGLMFVLRTVGITAALAFLIFNSLVAHTVLYLYAKASSGEIAEEFGREYVTLPYDDEKVPHLVSVVSSA